MFASSTLQKQSVRSDEPPTHVPKAFSLPTLILPACFARLSTDDTSGKMRGYVGEGRFTDDPLNTFGGAGVVEIPNLQRLLHFICERGFEHHAAANLSTVASPVFEASTRYLVWTCTITAEKTEAADVLDPSQAASLTT